MNIKTKFGQCEINQVYATGTGPVGYKIAELNPEQSKELTGAKRKGWGIRIDGKRVEIVKFLANGYTSWVMDAVIA